MDATELLEQPGLETEVETTYYDRVAQGIIPLGQERILSAQTYAQFNHFGEEMGRVTGFAQKPPAYSESFPETPRWQEDYFSSKYGEPWV